MRSTFFFLSLVVFSACQTAEDKKALRKTELNPAITEIVAFMVDSVSSCDAWLSQDNKVRRFFTENDSLANYLTNYFDHDQIVSWYQSIDTTTLLNLSAYLQQLDVSFVTHVDSLKRGCASAINAIAFSHQNKECLMLFVEHTTNRTTQYTLLLERPDEYWYIADTLNYARSQY
jgi:hypothetical protein